MFYATTMTRLTKGILCAAMLFCAVMGAGAFSLLGPFKGANFIGEPWQADGFGDRTEGLGYSLVGDIGGPMFPTEAYRWNIPVITYAFDLSFLRYFGTNGVVAVEEAMAILNALPPASQMSADLGEYSLDTRGENGTAAALGLLDVKSYALATVLEEMGLANPERFVWSLRGRVTGQFTTNYSVIQLNYDPVTLQPTRYVNGVLYNYVIFDALGPQGGEWASALEWYQLDPLHQPYSSVIGSINNSDFKLGSSPSGLTFSASLQAGQYFTGLTRDDVGAIRYLLSTNHMVFDTLLPTVLPRAAGSRSSPWSPVIGVGLTNAAGLSNIVSAVGTNFTNFVRTAFRPGVDKINFQRVAVLGTNFSPITLRYTDRYINPTNGRVVKQPVERLVVQPDIIFSVRDLGLVANGEPYIIERTVTDGWINNAALNSFTGPEGLGGPGTILPGIEISFSDLLPYWVNSDDGSGDSDAVLGLVWGSFDGTTRPPAVYPAYPDPRVPGLSLDYIQDAVLRGN